MKKKVLPILCVVLILLFALAFVACEKYKNDEDNDTTAPDATYTHTVKNGTFYSAKTTSTSTSGDTAILDDVSDWTQMSASTTSSKTGANGVLSAVVDLSDDTVFESLAEKYFNVTEDKNGDKLANTLKATNPGVDPKTPMVNDLDADGKTQTDENGKIKTKKEDTNALAIANTKEEGSLYVQSSTFTLASGKVYLLQFSVATFIDAAQGDKTKGAWFVLTGNNVEYTVPSINTNGQWKTYYLFILTNESATSFSAAANCWLGYGPKASTSSSETYKNDGKDAYATRGIAFFDNVLCEEIDIKDMTAAIAGIDANDANVATYGAYEYDESALDVDNFNAFKAALTSTKDNAGNAYVTAKNYYYLINGNMEIRTKQTSYYTTDSYRKYFYSFRDNYSNSNLQKYELSSSGTLDAKYYGNVDLSKLYTITDAEDKSKVKDNYSVNVTDFIAPGYDVWYDEIMHGDDHNLATAEETRALMIFNKDLAANKLKTTESVRIDANKYYEISVWAFVWAKTYDDGKYYKAFSTTEPVDPRSASGSFSEMEKQLYKLISKDGVSEAAEALMEGYLDELTADEKTKEAGYADALTAMGNLAYNGNGSETLRTNAAAWVRSLLNLEETANVANLTEQLYYTYLYKTIDTQVDEVKAKEAQLEKLYLYERVTNTGAYEKLQEKVDKYQSEHDDWALAKAEYEKKYTAWEEKNGYPKATVSLTGAGDVDEQTTTQLGKWEKITFKVQGNQLSARSVTVELAFGTGSDDSTYMMGLAFFDNIEVKEYATVDNAAEWVRLSEIKTTEEVAFGGLVGNAAYTQEAAQAVADANWTAEAGKDTAGADADNVSVQVLAWDETKDGSGKITVGSGENASEKYLYVLKYENAVATASTMKYVGEGAEILPNKFYRFAFLIKTEGVDEEKGVSISLTYGERADELTSVKDSSVKEYANESGEWKEVVYYIGGDILKTYYVGITVSMGSGTRFVTDSYVKGAVYLAAFNCLAIDYDEYKSAATGDKKVSGLSLYNISKEADSATYRFTNAYYSQIDYASTDEDQFDEDTGRLTGIGKTTSWTTESVLSNSYDVVTELELNSDTKKLSWKGADGVTSANGAIVEGKPTAYEIWMKYTDEDGKSAEKLYATVEATEENEDYEYDFTVSDAVNDWSNVKITYFAVKTIAADGVSKLTSYTTAYLGAADKTTIPAQRTTDKAEVKAGTVLSADVFAGEADGVHYVSPYDTLMKLTASYNSVLSVHSATINSGLAADGYYKIGVWAKSDVGTNISITLDGTSGALETKTKENELGFVNVSTNGEWVEYCFFIKTGNFTPKMYVKYSIGNPYAKAKTGKVGGVGESETYYDVVNFSKGNAYFDAVKVTTITKDEYENAKDADANKDAAYASANHEVVYTNVPYYMYVMEYVIDSFDASTVGATSTTTEKDTMGNTPSNYNHSNGSDLATGGTNAAYGVYDVTSEDETMRTALAQLYKYHDSDEDKDVFVFNKALKEAYGDAFVGGEWADEEWDAFLQTFLSVNRKENGAVVYEGGNNVLVMSNKAEGGYAQSYALDTTYNYKAAAHSYTKVTFSARTLLARVIVASTTTDDDGNKTYTYNYTKDNAFGELRVNPNSGNGDYVHVRISSATYGTGLTDDVTYTVYLYNPTDEEKSVNWTFYLGNATDDSETEETESYLDWYVIGMMAVDLVSVENVTEEAYTAATAAASGEKATAYTYEYKEPEEDDNDDKDDGDDGDKDEEKESAWDKIVKNEYFWLYISSFMIALAIIVTVIVVLVNKWKKKHPKEVIGENVAKTEKDIKVIPTAPQEKADAPEQDEYTEPIVPQYVQRKKDNSSRKDRKKGKK